MTRRDFIHAKCLMLSLRVGTGDWHSCPSCRVGTGDWHSCPSCELEERSAYLRCCTRWSICYWDFSNFGMSLNVIGNSRISAIQQNSIVGYSRASTTTWRHLMKALEMTSRARIGLCLFTFITKLRICDAHLLLCSWISSDVMSRWAWWRS